MHRAQRIAPDTYEVEVRLSNTGQVLLALGPILVPPEGHPVLTGDLRGRLHRHQLVVSSDAAQSSVAGFRWRASGTLHAWESVAGMWLHSAEVVATAPKVDVEASIAGFRTVRVSELSGREVAVAEPGLDVRFVLPGADALLADGHAKLLVNDLEVPWFKELDLELDAAGQATTRLGPGRYGARLRVGGRYTPQQDFAVLDTPDEQLVPLAQLAAHLAAWDDER